MNGFFHSVTCFLYNVSHYSVAIPSSGEQGASILFLLRPLQAADNSTFAHW